MDQPTPAPVTPPASDAAPVTPQADQASLPNGSQPLEVFAQNLLIERGALEMDAELVDGMKADLVDRLSLLANQVMIDALNDQDTAEFEKMVDNGATDEQLQAFAESKIPDLSQRLTAALLRFRSTYLGTVA